MTQTSSPYLFIFYFSLCGLYILFCLRLSSFILLFLIRYVTDVYNLEHRHATPHTQTQISIKSFFPYALSLSL